MASVLLDARIDYSIDQGQRLTSRAARLRTIIGGAGHSWCIEVTELLLSRQNQRWNGQNNRSISVDE